MGIIVGDRGQDTGDRGDSDQTAAGFDGYVAL